MRRIMMVALLLGTSLGVGAHVGAQSFEVPDTAGMSWVHVNGINAATAIRPEDGPSLLRTFQGSIDAVRAAGGRAGPEAGEGFPLLMVHIMMYGMKAGQHEFENP